MHILGYGLQPNENKPHQQELIWRTSNIDKYLRSASRYYCKQIIGQPNLFITHSGSILSTKKKLGTFGVIVL